MFNNSSTSKRKDLGLLFRGKHPPISKLRFRPGKVHHARLPVYFGSASFLLILYDTSRWKTWTSYFGFIAIFSTVEYLSIWIWYWKIVKIVSLFQFQILPQIPAGVNKTALLVTSSINLRNIIEIAETKQQVNKN